jgi:transposase
LELSSELREVVTRAAVARVAEYRVVVRARILVDAAAGCSNEENARRNGTRPDTVRKTRRRATSAASASEALADAPRSGRPPRIALETRAALVQIACSRPTPELARERVKARTRDALRAKKIAKKQLRSAKGAARRAARRATRAREVEVRERRRVAARAIKRANRDLAAAELALSAVRCDAARAAKNFRASFAAVWTQPALQAELARVTGETMSLSEIRRTLWCGGLRPHRVRMWLHSPDPDFAPKVKVIFGLYLNPPEDAVVLCVDEKTGMQARADLNPIHTSRSKEVRREFEYTRNGTQTLIAAFDTQTGEVFGRCWRRTAEGLIRFLEALAKKYPKGDVYIVWDNLNVHSGPAIDAFNARHGGRFHFVYTPLHASWMNQIEIWFSILQRRVLRHGSFTSKADLEAAVMGFIRGWNTVERRPFRWRFRGEFAPPLPWAA